MGRGAIPTATAGAPAGTSGPGTLATACHALAAVRSGAATMSLSPSEQHAHPRDDPADPSERTRAGPHQVPRSAAWLKLLNARLRLGSLLALSSYHAPSRGSEDERGRDRRHRRQEKPLTRVASARDGLESSQPLSRTAGGRRPVLVTGSIFPWDELLGELPCSSRQCISLLQRGNLVGM